MRVAVNRNYKYRIYPDDKQVSAINRFMGCCRFVWNQMLADEITNYQETGKFQLNTPAQYKKDHPFLRKADSQALANEWRRLNNAFMLFFHGTGGFPKFKSRKHPVTSYRSCVSHNNIRIEGNTVRMPKLGSIKIKLHRALPAGAKLLSVTIMIDESDHYFAVLTIKYELDISDVSGSSDNAVGLDYKSDGLFLSSDGVPANYVKPFKSLEVKLARAQRKLSGMVKGSKRYEKQKRRVAKIYRKMTDQRRDWLHKLSTEIADKYDIVCVEDLDLKGITKRGRFKLGKSTLDNGYGMFLSMLQYKLEERGKQFVKIDRYYPSTKTCCKCGATHDLKLSDRRYVCECGNDIDRDLNAAINIKNEGLRKIHS